jgi:hypothetical protein
MALNDFRDELAATAAALATPGTGLLAADESTGTIGKRFAAIGLENSEEHRRAYRTLLATTEGLNQHISGVILYEETLFQNSSAAAGGAPLVELFQQQGIVPGIKVDGMNVLNVRECVRFAKAYALEHGPIVLEMDTYRYHGHSMSDPGITYRNRDEVAGVRKTRDPIERAKRYLLELELATAAELKDIETAARVEVDEAVEKAKAAVPPVRDLLFEDIYVNQSKQFYIRACDRTVDHGVMGVTK